MLYVIYIYVKTSLDINIDKLITDIYQHYYDVNTNSQNISDISDIKYIKYNYNQKMLPLI